MAKAEGLRGNLSELSLAWIKREYGALLTDDEVIVTGFELVRDCVLFTNKRIINIDRCGFFGKKRRITSIYLSQVVGVTAVTAGTGVDDHKIFVRYISSVYCRAAVGLQTVDVRYEFPKRFDYKPLYRWLQGVALENYERLNA